MEKIFRSFTLDFPVDKVFSWFSNQGFLKRGIPPFLPISHVNKTKDLKEGLEIPCEIRMLWKKSPWLLEVKEFVLNKHLVIRQKQGPFAYWEYELNFSSKNESTEILQSVSFHYGKYLDALIKKKVLRAFAYQEEILANDLRTVSAYFKAEGPKKVLISGGSGFVGSALAPFLQMAGIEVAILGRSKRTADITWDPKTGKINPEELENFDAVIHLAGENIIGYWSAKKKRRIFRSRVESTKQLSHILSLLKNPPKLLITASAIGYYGDRGEEMLTEASSVGNGFLADVCKHWEDASKPARTQNIRTVHTRFGMILSPGGGALQKMLPLFKMGLGGRLGSGRQYTSWITIDDVTGAMYNILMSSNLEGPVNFVSPKPLTNKSFTQILANSLQRPVGPPVPAFILRGLFGQMGKEVFLSSARVVPQRLLENGYRFLYPDLKQSLDHLLQIKQ
ncbi:MAG: TIGR01777 family oxidoreductase [Simkaniaceae bacterium]